MRVIGINIKCLLFLLEKVALAEKRGGPVVVANGWRVHVVRLRHGCRSNPSVSCVSTTSLGRGATLIAINIHAPNTLINTVSAFQFVARLTLENSVRG
jgi:hypothetical protein